MKLQSEMNCFSSQLTMARNYFTSWLRECLRWKVSVVLAACLAGALLPGMPAHGIGLPQALLVENWPTVSNEAGQVYPYNGVLPLAGHTAEGGPYYAHPEHNGIIRMERSSPGSSTEGRWVAQYNGAVDFFQKTPTASPSYSVAWGKTGEGTNWVVGVWTNDGVADRDEYYRRWHALAFDWYTAIYNVVPQYASGSDY